MNVVTEHVLELLNPLTEDFKVFPKEGLTPREIKLFWRYQGHFPSEFAAALHHAMPENYELVSYDHLQNKLHVKYVESK